MVAALLLAIPVFGQEAGRTAVIWHDGGDAAALDVVSGAGGKERMGKVRRAIGFTNR